MGNLGPIPPPFQSQASGGSPPSPFPARNAIYTIAEVAARYSVTPATVRRWLFRLPAAKRLGHFRVGAVVRTNESLLAQFWAANEVDFPRHPRTALLEADVTNRTYAMIGEMARIGRVALLPPPLHHPHQTAA